MIILGVLLEIIATVAGTVGKQMMRYSKLIEEHAHPCISRLVLAVGLLINIFTGPALEVAAFGQAPQTLLAPLCGLDVLWTVLLVPHTLGEYPTWTQFVGCFLIVGGTAITAASGPHVEPPYTLETMRQRLLTDSALVYISAEAVLLTAGALYMSRRPAGDPRRGLVLGLVAGAIGGNLFFMKAAASLISSSWSGGFSYVWRMWISDPLPFLVASGALFIGFVSAVLLTSGMREFEATMMVATYEGAFVLSGCLSGIAVLGELDDVSWERRAIYAVGVVTVVLGVVFAQHAEEIVVRSLSPPATPLSPSRRCSRGNGVSVAGAVATANAGRAPLLQAEADEEL